MPDLGFFNIDKPSGMTSHDVVSAVRRGTKTKKVGHAGTLDPMATGVLVICWNRATRLSDYVMAGTKGYIATLRLGVETDTYDAEGEVVATIDTPVTEAAFGDVLPPFRGDIKQIPPMYSAIKKDGKKLYELAREGKTIEREARSVTIYALELLTFDYPDAHVHVTCSSGTYIRSLAHDIGASLGVGAHLTALRRTAVGAQFTIEHAVPLDKLKQAFADNRWEQYLVSVDDGLSHMPRVELDEEQATNVAQGRFLKIQETWPGPVRAYDASGRFIALLERRSPDGDIWKPLKVFI